MRLMVSVVIGMVLYGCSLAEADLVPPPLDGAEFALITEGAIKDVVRGNCAQSISNQPTGFALNLFPTDSVTVAFILFSFWGATLPRTTTYSLPGTVVDPTRVRGSLQLRLPISSFHLQAQAGQVEVTDVSSTTLAGTFDLTFEGQRTKIRAVGQLACRFDN